MNPEAPFDELNDHWGDPPPSGRWWAFVVLLVGLIMLGMVVFVFAQDRNTFSAVMLVVTVITGTDKQNIQHRAPMPDMKTCLEEAEAFMNHKFPDTVDAKGLVASCQGKLTENDPS